MTILVTGGNGFIGTNFIKFLSRKTVEPIVNIDCKTYAANEAVDHLSTTLPLTCYPINICETDKILEIIQISRPRAIFHLAAESHVDRSIDSGDEFIQTNIVGTYSILKATHAYWKQLSNGPKSTFRFIHVSTDEVFGSASHNGPKFSEDTQYNPSSAYSASKASSDHLVKSYFKTFKLPTIVTNCSNNYGPYQNDEKFLPTIINSILDNKKIPVYGDGLQVRDWLFVEDHCEALWAVFESGKVGESYNVGGNCELNNLQLINLALEIFSELYGHGKTVYVKDNINFISDRLGHDKRYAIDATKIMSHTNWRPKNNIKPSLRATIEWYVEQKRHNY
jgi:dTDP-glucose 4,6-dehydratase